MLETFGRTSRGYDPSFFCHMADLISTYPRVLLDGLKRPFQQILRPPPVSSTILPSETSPLTVLQFARASVHTVRNKKKVKTIAIVRPKPSPGNNSPLRPIENLP